MMTQYKALFSLQVAHDYCSGVCEDVGFVVPPDVAKRMNGAGLIAKVLDGAFNVFFKANLAGAAERPPFGGKLRVGLSVVGDALANVTEGFEPRAGVWLYRNNEAAGALGAPTRLPLGGSRFAARLSRAERPVRVALEANAGQVVRSETITASNDRSDVAFDLAGLPASALTFIETYSAEVVRTSRYVDPYLSRANIFGIVELDVGGAFYQSAQHFGVTLPARLETLRYYIVAKGFSNGDTDQLAVLDQGSGTSPVQFERVQPDALSKDEKSKSDILGGDGSRVLLFRSSSVVARRCNGRKRIQLMRNNEALIENLPQPGRDRGTADLVIHLSKSKS